MRRVLLYVTVLCSCVAIALGQEEAAKPVITATGTAAVTVPADSVRYELLVQTRADTPDQAVAKARRAAEEVAKALRALEIEDLRVDISVRRMLWGDAHDAPAAQADITVALTRLGQPEMLNQDEARVNATLWGQWEGFSLGFRGDIAHFASTEAEARAAQQAMRTALERARANARALTEAQGMPLHGKWRSTAGSHATYTTREAASAAGAGLAWERLVGTADGGRLLVYTVTLTIVP